MLDVDPHVRDVLEVIAVLGSVALDEVEDIAEPDARAALTRAVAAGHVLVTGSDPQIALSSVGLGTQLRDSLRRERPARVTELLRRHADLRLVTGRIDGGLSAARALGDLERLARIVDRWGIDLAHSPFAAAMFEVVSELPIELATSLPGLALRLEDIGRLPIGTTQLPLPRTAHQAEDEVARNGDLRLRQVLLPLVTRRRLGRFEEAMAVVRTAEPLAEACVYPLYGGRSGILPYWHLQAGITAQLAGDLDTARRYFLNAWSHRSRDPYGFVARGAAGRIALTDALLGARSASIGWLEEARRCQRRADLWIDRLVESNLACVEAINAVDGLDPRTDAIIATTPHPTQRDEQWALFLWLHVRHALTRGDTAEARRCLEDSLAAPRTPGARGGLAGTLVPLARADVHLASGQANQALAELAGTPDLDGGVGVLHARTLLLAADAPAALVRAETVVDDRRTSPRWATEAHLVIAAARHLAGDRVGAVTAARRAAARALGEGTPRALATVPRTVLDDLAPDVPGLTGLLDVLDQRGITDIYPKAVPLVTLTRREHDLLRTLSSGMTLTQIARGSFVSINTTRTHLASLRRKLDARSRDEVVIKARQLGLL